MVAATWLVLPVLRDRGPVGHRPPSAAAWPWQVHMAGPGEARDPRSISWEAVGFRRPAIEPHFSVFRTDGALASAVICARQRAAMSNGPRLIVPDRAESAAGADLSATLGSSYSSAFHVG